MNLMKLFAAALAALAIGGTSAEAGCKFANISNKTWMINATDISGVHRALIYCKFTTPAAGTVPFRPNGCVIYDGATSNFGAPVPINLISASFTQVPGEDCAFDLSMVLVNPAAQALTARIVMESGKTMGTGSWMSNFSAFGTISIMRQ